MQRPHRRTVLAGLALPAVAAMTDLGYASDELARTRANLARVAADWNSVGATENLTAAYAAENHLAIVARPGLSGQWAEVAAAALVMLAQIQADSGLVSLAADTAQRAQHVAVGGGRHLAHLDADAQIVSAEIYNGIAPQGAEPVAMLAAARALAGRSHVAVRATVSEATARAGQGAPAGEVQALLAVAETMQTDLPASAGHPPWTRAHLFAFGGVALVRCGALSAASNWLTLAARECVDAGMPGLGTAVTLYQAQGYAAAEDWDTALAWATDAVASATPRGTAPAWLTGGVGRLVRQADGAGGDWTALAAFAA